MKISDPDQILSDQDLPQRIVKSHPLNPALDQNIDKIVICGAGYHFTNGSSIEFDDASRMCRLHLPKDIELLDNYEFIFFHEFSHVADRTNPDFKYSDRKKTSLSDAEQLILMELWNVYIDARLNHHQLFRLGENDKGIICEINGKQQIAPFSIEGKLLCHISFVRSRGFKKADSIVRDIWDNPNKFRSYDDLIKLVKDNT